MVLVASAQMRARAVPARAADNSRPAEVIASPITGQHVWPPMPRIPMNLKLPITVVDELAEHEIRAQGELDLASGDITIVQYEDYDIATEGLPAQHQDYAFTVGVLSKGGRDIEFGVRVDRMSGRYSVTPDELLEIKGRAAKLFSQPPGAATTR
jgi:hypothetical protein